MRNNLLRSALLASIVGTAVYIAIAIAIIPAIQRLYDDPAVFYAPSHFLDARQYVYICNQGYDLPQEPTFLFGKKSRVSWMPLFAWLQCGLHLITNISLVYTGNIVSAIAVLVTLFFGTLTLNNLNIRFPELHALAALVPLVGGIWLYLPSVETCFLAIGMLVMWLLTMPFPADNPQDRAVELTLTLMGILLGILLMLTKPNALAMLLPLAFAFFYLSWKRSINAGYGFGLGTFIADIVIEIARPFLRVNNGLYKKIFSTEDRPMWYCWTPAGMIVGILVAFAYWLAFTSLYSGVPFYFLRLQLEAWPRAWPVANLSEMTLYFLQAFRGIDAAKAWRYMAAWYLAAHVAVVIPAASSRVPALIRGMLVLMMLFMLYSGAVEMSDRYIVSTALVSVGWSCWLAPRDKIDAWAILRWLFVLLISATTSFLLLYHMFPQGLPQPFPIEY